MAEELASENDEIQKNKMTNAIKYYGEMKNQLLDEKIEEIRREIDSINYAKHPELLAKYKTLEETKQLKMWQAEQTREAKLKQVEETFQNELKLAEEDYRIDKGALRDAYMQTTLENLKKVQDEKVHIVSKLSKNPAVKLTEIATLTSTYSTPVPTTVTERITRTRKKRDPSDDFMPAFTKKKYGSLGPAIVWSLKSSDIEEDLKIIKKPYSNGKKNSV